MDQDTKTNTSTTAICTHHEKIRLIGRDARLWECANCPSLFVEGDVRSGEKRWIRVPTPIDCDYCLDGYGHYSRELDACNRCGTSHRRTGK